MTDDFDKFKACEKYWLRDYALYSMLKKKNGERCWAEWAAEFASRDETALARFEAEYRDELALIEFTQFIFFRQLGALSDYCAQLGVELMGDAPIYVAWDGADVWAARGLFDLEPDGRPRCVAGVPPDYFSETGQALGQSSLQMGRDAPRRLRMVALAAASYFEILRYGAHRPFPRLSAFWEIPASCKTAKEGCWRPALAARCWRRSARSTATAAPCR